MGRREALEIALFVAVIPQVRWAGKVPEDVRLVYGGEVGGFEVDALAGAEEGTVDAVAAGVARAGIVCVLGVGVGEGFAVGVLED